MPMTERQLAAAKADKYIGRDGGVPLAVQPQEDVAVLARILSSAPPRQRHAAFAALARISGLPVGTVRQMADDCPF